MAAGFLRQSTLPVAELKDALDASGLGVEGFICTSGDGGGFLSEFIGYLGTWYQSMHADPSDPAYCVAAGHVHVGRLIPWPTAELSVDVALRVLIETIDERYPGDAIAVAGRTAAKSLRVGGGLEALSREIRQPSLFSGFANPAEAPLPSDGPIQSLAIDYPPRDLEVAGIGVHWLVFFLVVSVVPAYLVKGLFGVEA